MSLQNGQLQFGMAAPTFTSPVITDNRCRSTTIISRGISTTNLTYPTFQTKLSYTLIAVNTPGCVSSGTFVSPPPQLQYRYGSSDSVWMNIEQGKDKAIQDCIVCHNVSYTVDVSVVSKDGCVSVTDIVSNVNGSAKFNELFQFRFVQQEHRGGFCDCWAVANLTLTHFLSFDSQELNVATVNYSKLCGVNTTTTNFFHPTIKGLLQQDNIVAGFCEDSASIPREFVAQFGNDIAICDDSVIKDPPTQCSELDQRM